MCRGSPVSKDYALGRKFNINGTPALVLDNGELLGGYLPPPVLAERLRDDK